MDTKAVTKMTAAFYEPWDQVIHISKFAKQMTKKQAYLQTTGFNISDKNKLQFYTEQMINSKRFNTRNIIE